VDTNELVTVGFPNDVTLENTAEELFNVVTKAAEAAVT